MNFNYNSLLLQQLQLQLTFFEIKVGSYHLKKNLNAYHTKQSAALTKVEVSLVIAIESDWSRTDNQTIWCNGCL